MLGLLHRLELFHRLELVLVHKLELVLVHKLVLGNRSCL
jgi:hypothetical protein